MNSYEDGLRDAAARVAAADEAVGAAASEEDRAAAERRALRARCDLARSLSIGLLDRGPIPGLPPLVLLGDWLRDHADRFGTDALDDLGRRDASGGPHDVALHPLGLRRRDGCRRGRAGPTPGARRGREVEGDGQ